MKFVLSFLVGVFCAFSVLAQEETNVVPSIEGGFDFSDFSEAFENDAMFFLEDKDIEKKSAKPVAFGDCLMGDDGLTPIYCVNSSQFRMMPEGFEWRNNPDAHRYKPQHCLWWVEGKEFVGHPVPSVCREGSAPEKLPSGVLMKF